MDEPTVDAESPRLRRSRRQLLTGAAGAAGVIAVGTLAKAAPAGAATGNPVILGGSNSAGAPTVIVSSPGDVMALQAGSSGRGLLAAGVGADGVDGQSDVGTGVSGTSTHGTGVSGTGGDGGGALSASPGVTGTGGSINGGNAGNGVEGYGGSGTGAADGMGVLAVGGGSSSGIGLLAQGTGSGVGVLAYGGPNGGVGVQAQGTGAPGVSASSDTTDGVAGSSASGYGVHGTTNADLPAVYGQSLGTGTGAIGVQGDGSDAGVLGYGGRGVYGLPTSGGTGVVASGALDGTGIGLDVVGPAQFLLSGLASIAAGAKSVTVTGVSLRSGSLVLATVQNNAGASVENAIPNVAHSKITINLNKAVPAGKTASVAWFVVN